MAYTQADVVAKAVLVGKLDSNDSALMERVDVTAEMVILKTEDYIGYDPLEVDKLKPILAEITVTEITHYQNLRTTALGDTKRITRGDYTVEYGASKTDSFNSYEWLLKKYKKLRSL